MILKKYYEQKSNSIKTLLSNQFGDITVALYSDTVFTDTSYSFPLVLFKYEKVAWNTSSEKEYKADVDFSVYIVLSPSQSDYLEAFDIANSIDRAVLLHPNKQDLKQNKAAIAADPSVSELITNATFKVSECQHTVDDDFWEKNNFFIWEIGYKTTLIETIYKKRYTMITNDSFTESEVQNNTEEIRLKLIELGFDLDDYYLAQKDGKPLLIFKNIEEQLETDKATLTIRE